MKRTQTQKCKAAFGRERDTDMEAGFRQSQTSRYKSEEAEKVCCDGQRKLEIFELKMSRLHWRDQQLSRRLWTVQCEPGVTVSLYVSMKSRRHSSVWLAAVQSVRLDSGPVASRGHNRHQHILETNGTSVGLVLVPGIQSQKCSVEKNL